MPLFDTSAPQHHARMVIVLLILLLSVAGNVLAIWWYGGKTLHYIPVSATGQAGAEQTSRPGEFPVAIQTRTAELVVKTLGNVTPESLLPAIETVRPYLAPGTYTRLHTQGNQESRIMRAANLAIMTTHVVLSRVTPLSYNGYRFLRLTFDAQRHLYSYGIALEPHPVTVVVDVMPPQIGTGLGESLRITQVAWPPLKIKQGEFQNFSFVDNVADKAKPFRRGVTRQ